MTLGVAGFVVVVALVDVDSVAVVTIAGPVLQ